ncbi:MAG: cytochrome c biogenesis protein CcdA [Rhodobacteraceae bacterium]|nr:cytochrome c biogenesis protein CcdA [Paracoccaceae bacterium]
MFDVSLFGAVLAGLLSFASPCVLPIVPFYLSYLAGTGLSDLQSGAAITSAVRRKAFISAICFSLGIIIIFVGMGATATVFGAALRDWFGVLRWAAAAIIFLMGLHFVGLFKIGALNRQFTLNIGNTDNVSFGMAFLLGLAFAFGWTPCVGPILAAILFTAAASENVWQGIYLLIAYGIGMTAPFVFASIFIGPFLRWAAGFRKHLGRVEKAMGGLLIFFAVLIATNSVGEIAGWMLRIAPDFWTFG